MIRTLVLAALIVAGSFAGPPASSDIELNTIQANVTQQGHGHHRSHHHHSHVGVCRVTGHRADGAPSISAIDNLVACVTHRPRFRLSGATPNIRCIGDAESTDYAFANNGHGDKGFLQESDVPLVWSFFKTGVYGGHRYARPHKGRWAARSWNPHAPTAAYNARLLALADVWWIKFFGAGRWSTAGRCGM